MILTFSKKEVLALVMSCVADKPGQVPYTGGSWGEAAKFERGLTLVGDQGVYWMSNAPNQKKVEGSDSYPVAHSRECDPEKNDFDTWWANKNASFGADDGCDFFTIEQINSWLAGNKTRKLIKIDIDSKGIRLL